MQKFRSQRWPNATAPLPIYWIRKADFLIIFLFQIVFIVYWINSANFKKEYPVFKSNTTLQKYDLLDFQWREQIFLDLKKFDVSIKIDLLRYLDKTVLIKSLTFCLQKTFILWIFFWDTQYWFFWNYLSKRRTKILWAKTKINHIIE